MKPEINKLLASVDAAAKAGEKATARPWRWAEDEWNKLADDKHGKRKGDRLLMALVGPDHPDDLWNGSVEYRRFWVLVQRWSLFKKKTLVNSTPKKVDCDYLVAAANLDLPAIAAALRRAKAADELDAAFKADTSKTVYDLQSALSAFVAAMDAVAKDAQ